jgi:hypothetical protein
MELNGGSIPSLATTLDSPAQPLDNLQTNFRRLKTMLPELPPSAARLNLPRILAAIFEKHVAPYGARK